MNIPTNKIEAQTIVTVESQTIQTMANLRAVFAPCCGLGANRELVDSSLNQLESLLETRNSLVKTVRHSLAKAFDGMNKGHAAGIATAKIEIVDAIIAIELDFAIGAANGDKVQALCNNLPKPTPNKEKAIETKAAIDAVEIHYEHLKSLLWVEKVVIDYEFGLACGFFLVPKKRHVKRQTPWDYDATFKLIDRRINRAIKARDFTLAKSIEDMRLALVALQVFDSSKIKV